MKKKSLSSLSNKQLVKRIDAAVPQSPEWEALMVENDVRYERILGHPLGRLIDQIADEELAKLENRHNLN